MWFSWTFRDLIYNFWMKIHKVMDFRISTLFLPFLFLLKKGKLKILVDHQNDTNRYIFPSWAFWYIICNFWICGSKVMKFQSLTSFSVFYLNSRKKAETFFTEGRASHSHWLVGQWPRWQATSARGPRAGLTGGRPGLARERTVTGGVASTDPSRACAREPERVRILLSTAWGT